MHPTAMNNAKLFFDCYGSDINKQGLEIKVIEIGSQDVNGSLRGVCPPSFNYVGVDFVPGRGVDVVLDDPYELPFDTESVDVVVSSSCFEHSEMFWILFLEILRILKPTGLLYLNVPSNGDFHRWPVDCWRFYPDSGRALVTWARRNGVNAWLLESYTSTQVGDQWNDFVAIFLKSSNFESVYRNKILNTKNDITNGVMNNGSEFIKYSQMPEDRKKLKAISDIVANVIKVV